jgi:hypothetical protein
MAYYACTDNYCHPLFEVAKGIRALKNILDFSTVDFRPSYSSTAPWDAIQE